MEIPNVICCLCGIKFRGWDNNPEPLAFTGECCDDCNLNKVVPARLNNNKRLANPHNIYKD